MSGDPDLEAMNDPYRLIRYGHLLLDQGRRPEAFAVAARAERLVSASATLDDALGTLLAHLEETMRALEHHIRAVERAPDRVDFRYNLAMTQRMVGDLDAAEANLDQVLLARPLDGEAHYARSGLRTQTRSRNHVDELVRVLRQLEGRRAALPVAFSLAKELEDLGDYSHAFAYLDKGCRAYRASLKYDVADDIAVLERLRFAHVSSTLRQLRATFNNRECIFIIGLPRSEVSN
jgi:tetratricopeptide (TPR) repeat protein